MKKALIAMSGGVDSTAAAYLIRNEGWECSGVTIRMFDGGCTTEESIRDAVDVSKILGIPHKTVDHIADFSEKVISRFISSYENGATPNPCIDCNRYIKFPKMYDIMDSEGFDKVVTGHYARIEYEKVSGRYILKKAKDTLKDQSYVLYSLTNEQLSKTLFPVGNFGKDEIREIARNAGLTNSDKADSQDICFIPDGKYSEFIKKSVGHDYPHGNFVTTDGKVLGEHKGIINYTVGQRRGLGLALERPMYVCKIDTASNSVILGYTEDLMSKEFTVRNINLIATDDLKSKTKLYVKVRYQHKEQPALVEQTGEDELTVEFETPQRAVTKGQSAVLYDGDTVVGGGIIS